MNSYVLSALIGMAAMSVGLFFTNKYSMMISPRIGMMIAQAITVIVIYIWIRAVGDKFVPAFKAGWAPIGYVFLAGLFIAMGLLGLVEAFSKGGPGNVVIPIWGSMIIWSALLTTVFLGGSMTVLKGVGIAAAFVGIVLVSVG